jgi:hypothetical protein
MIGIYQDSFLQYLKDFLGESIKVTSKNLIAPCPFCGEHKKKKSHYHLYISIEAPMFHCFAGDCNTSGSLSKLLNKLEGRDISEKFIVKEKIKEIQKHDIKFSKPIEKQKLFIPEINEDMFKLKTLYLKGRLKYSIQNLKNIKGLIFDSDKFIEANKIKIDDKLKRIQSYLQTNFIGFLTENESLIMFRNIDDTSDFRFFKLYINQTRFLDYYKLLGGNFNSNHVIIGEGIFDIFGEQIFDYTNLRKDVKLYAAGLSTSYESLIKSLAFNEGIYRMNVSILSDRGIDLNDYKKIKRKNSHIIDQMNIYYNKLGKDFGGSSVSAEKFIL